MRQRWSIRAGSAVALIVGGILLSSSAVAAPAVDAPPPSSDPAPTRAPVLKRAPVPSSVATPSPPRPWTPPPTTVSIEGRITGYRLSAAVLDALRVYLYEPGTNDGSTEPLRGTTVASNGTYRFDGLPLGARYEFVIRYFGTTAYERDIAAVRRPVNVILGGQDWVSRDSDLSGDRLPDLVVRDPNGVVWVYKGDGKGRITGKYTIATGWGSMTALVRPGDWDRDGFADLIARDTAGTMWVYPGDGQGGLGPRYQLTTGWGQYRSITAVSGYQFEESVCLFPLDPDRHNVWMFCRDGLGNFSEQRPDPLGGSVYGELYSYPLLSSVAGAGDFVGLGRPGFFHRSTWPPEFGGGWEYTAYAMTGPVWYKPMLYGEPWVSDVAFAGAGDFDGNFRGDMVSQDKSGRLWLVRSSGSVYNINSVSVSRTQIGHGFTGYTLFR